MPGRRSTSTVLRPLARLPARTSTVRLPACPFVCIDASLPPPASTRLQVLHDAFFKYQTKPKLAGVGEQ